MGKKKFIDKKKAATFQLMARDTSDPLYSSDPSGDRVFVRVDNNQYAPDYFDNGEPNNDPDSIFADAPDDCAAGYDESYFGAQTTALPDHVRKEILELGFPDDGYNYLLHLREIKNTGGGSAYFHNPKASFDRLPQDVKAYDASRVEVYKPNNASEEDKAIYNMASKAIGVRLQKVVDPEVAALLDDSDLSKFGSDEEDELEEDFVSRANILEGTADEEIHDKASVAAPGSKPHHLQGHNSVVYGAPESETHVTSLHGQWTRERRPLDEQFDMLELNEYGDDDSEEEYYGNIGDDECEESFTEKLNNAFKNHPSDLLHKETETVNEIEESPEETAEVIHRCREYAKKYEDEVHDEEDMMDDESSSDGSEVWDCETIVSTYSTLDNHPGKIAAPEARRTKKLAEALSGASSGANPVISLKGKDRLPVDFLPRNRKHDAEKIKEKDLSDTRTELPKRKPRSEETKEEKKARKSAVKSERREARQTKKEMKGLYKSEAHQAQKVAAFTGPSSIHLM